MEKITVGRTRKKSKAAEKSAVSGRRGTADAVFVFGAAAVCVMLTMPLLGSAKEPSFPAEEAAVMVFGTGVQAADGIPEREELAAPSGRETEEEWNFYDYIGELFAGLISGWG